VACQVIISRIAQRDLAKIHDYLARQNPEAARSFTEKLVEEAKSLKIFPNRGGHLEGRPGVRFTVVKHYLIVYRVVEAKGEVRVLSFWHAARERHHLRTHYKISG
jgi:addiction module RelE/StbE family toxin